MFALPSVLSFDCTGLCTWFSLWLVSFFSSLVEQVYVGLCVGLDSLMSSSSDSSTCSRSPSLPVVSVEKQSPASQDLSSLWLLSVCLSSLAPLLSPSVFVCAPVWSCVSVNPTGLLYGTYPCIGVVGMLPGSEVLLDTTCSHPGLSGGVGGGGLGVGDGKITAGVTSKSVLVVGFNCVLP